MTLSRRCRLRPQGERRAPNQNVPSVYSHSCDPSVLLTLTHLVQSIKNQMVDGVGSSLTRQAFQGIYGPILWISEPPIAANIIDIKPARAAVNVRDTLSI